MLFIKIYSFFVCFLFNSNCGSRNRFLCFIDKEILFVRSVITFINQPRVCLMCDYWRGKVIDQRVSKQCVLKLNPRYCADEEPTEMTHAMLVEQHKMTGKLELDDFEIVRTVGYVFFLWNHTSPIVVRRRCAWSTSNSIHTYYILFTVACISFNHQSTRQSDSRLGFWFLCHHSCH